MHDLTETYRVVMQRLSKRNSCPLPNFLGDFQLPVDLIES